MINSKEVNSVGVFSKVPMQDTDTVLSMIISRKGQFSLFPVVHTFQRHKFSYVTKNIPDLIKFRDRT